MKPNITTETKHYIICPWCDVGRFQVDHLFNINTTFGTWYCDNCGHAIKGKVENKEIEIELVENFKEDTHVLLEFPPNKEPMFLVTKGFNFSDTKEDHNAYYYNQHTCPINYLRSATSVMIGDDSDPHGLFKYRGNLLVKNHPELADLNAKEILNKFNIRH